MYKPDVFILCRSKGANNSSALLERALKERGVKAYRVTARHRPRYDISRARYIINHGVSVIPVWLDSVPRSCEWLNTGSTVSNSANKVRMMQQFRTYNVPTLEWTLSGATAKEWYDSGDTVVCRGLLEGCQGSGITLAPPEELVACRLYTKLFEGHKVREYRVAIVGEEAVDLTEKRRLGKAKLEERGIEDTPYTTTIRAHKNGWVFARNTIKAGVNEQARIKEVALHAAQALDLQWGAVDLILRRDEDTNHISDILVVETNTSIGLDGDGTGLQVLADALTEVVSP